MHFKAKNHLFMKAERTSFFITWLTQKYMYNCIHSKGAFRDPIQPTSDKREIV